MAFRATICLVLVFTFAVSVAVNDDLTVKLFASEKHGESPGEARDLQELLKIIPGGSPVLSSIVCFAPVVLVQLLALLRRKTAFPHSYLTCSLVAMTWVIGVAVLDVMIGIPYLLAAIAHTVNPGDCILCFLVLFGLLEAAITRLARKGEGKLQ